MELWNMTPFSPLQKAMKEKNKGSNFSETKMEQGQLWPFFLWALSQQEIEKEIQIRFSIYKFSLLYISLQYAMISYSMLGLTTHDSSYHVFLRVRSNNFDFKHFFIFLFLNFLISLPLVFSKSLDRSLNFPYKFHLLFMDSVPPSWFR